MTRLEKAARAKEMRDRGMLLREIAEEMGVVKTTVSAWLVDPDGSKLRARKDSYRGTCKTCGARTDGSNGPSSTPVECQACFNERRHAERYWTRERLIESAQEFSRRYGHPPTAGDWNAGSPTAVQRERYHRDGCWPPYPIVVREFGRWNALIEAAGFALLGVGQHQGLRGQVAA